ncbi:hypothetical protein M8J76_013475 [Diaphorina citri]|nr:hypothetical protein M8J76_013475 [Diaphorina citri]
MTENIEMNMNPFEIQLDVEENEEGTKEDFTENNEKQPVKTFSDLKILLQVMKKHFSSKCPDCIDVLYDTMLRTATSAFNVNPCPILNQCCEDCYDFFRELLIRDSLTGSSYCIPGRRPNSQNCTFCRPCCSTKCNMRPRNCTCSCRVPCCKRNPKPICCSRTSIKCRPSISCCTESKRKSKSSKKNNSKCSLLADKYKPKSALIAKQKFLKKEIERVKQHICQCSICCDAIRKNDISIQTKPDDDKEIQRE